MRDESWNFAEVRFIILTPSIPTDTLVYSEGEFDRLRADPSSLVAQEFPSMMEL
jgi:hypothetical protein